MSENPYEDNDDEAGIPQQCCACGKKKPARNIWMLDVKGPAPGKGWGCVQCGLPSDGAIAAFCDECAAMDPPPLPQFVFDGYVMEGKLMRFQELPGIPHVHDMAFHEDEQNSN
jgi:hypothetical protein